MIADEIELIKKERNTNDEDILKAYDEISQ
jgi:hypothetical protein